MANGAPNFNSPLPGIFPQSRAWDAGDATPSAQSERGQAGKERTQHGPGDSGGAGWGGAGRGLVLVGEAWFQFPALLTLLSVARITRQHASTGPTPLSDREPAVRPLGLSAHRLWLGEMPGSWAEKWTPQQVRTGRKQSGRLQAGPPAPPS